MGEGVSGTWARVSRSFLTFSHSAPFLRRSLSSSASCIIVLGPHPVLLLQATFILYYCFNASCIIVAGNCFVFRVYVEQLRALLASLSFQLRILRLGFGVEG